MKFIRQQEEKFALRLLTWKYQKMNLPVPPENVLVQQAARIVNEAHRIAKARGQNILEIMKELINSTANKKL